MTRRAPDPGLRNESSLKPRRDWLGWPLSIAAHAVLVLTLIALRFGAEEEVPTQSSIVVNLMEEDSGLPGGTSGGADQTPTAKAPETQAPLEPVADPAVEPLAEEAVALEVKSAPINTSDLMTEAELAGAASADAGGDGTGAYGAGADGAGSGGGAGGCNTARVLQAALRKDPMVLSAVAKAGRAGKAVRLWDGEWIRAGDQDGRGLSGVRQALLWELGFAPEACRTKEMRGLITLSLQDGTRFAIGTEHWRWSDLLGLAKTPLDR